MANDQATGVVDEKQASADNGERQRGIDAQKKARSGRIRLVLLGLLAAAVIASIPLYSYYSARESTDDAQVDGHVVPISPRISGTIISVLVNDNEEVAAGQELVKLDPADYQVAMEQAKADLEDARASTTEAFSNVPITGVTTRSSIRTTESDVIQARSGVVAAEQQVNAAKARLEYAKSRLAQSQANNTKAQRDLARYKELVDKDEISKQQYDAAVAQAEANQADVASSQASIIEAQNNVDSANANLLQARARLGSADVTAQQSQQTAPNQRAAIAARAKSSEAKVQEKQAVLDMAGLNLKYTILKAPVSGVVTKKNAEPGQRTQPGENLMVLVPLDDVWVTANFKETQLKKMRVGQKVQIEVDAYGSRKYEGHIDSIAAVSGSKTSLLPPENATGNYVKVVQRVPVKIVLEKGQNQDHLLRPGMSVSPTVLLNSTTDSH